MTHTVSFHPAALAEVEDVEAWYAAERVELADAFVADLEATVSRVAGNPLAFAERSPGVRQAQLRRFPYLLVFRLRDEGVEVVAVAHGHRAPRYWRDR
ncbi:MAG TPA: type II toxin-antitoxin system RelE/ParE family toxin [Myxococcota bacterium]|nr:type II toxin-antitoxin system RelE/ParE family toxin [Myxococcota bacterium]